MAYTVRCATDSDSSAVRQLLQDLSPHCPVTDFLLRPDFSVEDLQQHRALCYLCFETTAQLPVGLCIASRTYYVATGHMLTITGVYVDPGHRRRGICSAMVNALLRDDSVKAITRVDVEIPKSEGTAHTAFEALGFRNMSVSKPIVNYKLPSDAYEQMMSRHTRPGVYVVCLNLCNEEGKKSAFRLRKATPQDVGDILCLVTEMEEMHNSAVNTDTDILLRDMNNGCFSCVLVEDTSAGKTVGQCIVIPFYSVAHGRSGRIDDLILDKTYRGKGLGGALIQACCQVAKSQGIEFVDLQAATWNEGAIKVYEHLGFVKDSVYNFSVGGDDIHQLRSCQVMNNISIE